MRDGATILRVLAAVLLLLGVALLNLTWWMQRAGTTVCSRVHTDVIMIGCIAEEFALAQGGRWPSSMDELLGSEATKRRLKGWIPLDTWGRPYRLEPSLTPGGPPRILTLGRDGKPGGRGDDADFDDSMLWGPESDAAEPTPR